MNGVFDKLYNGFLLRDILGYAIPGSFVMVSFAHMYARISNLTLSDLISPLADNAFAYVVAAGLSYASGHILSGLFFHAFLFRRIFRYSPPQLAEAQPGKSYDEAWLAHRVSFRQACEGMAESVQSQIERHAALVHFTGHFAAGVIFVILYIVFLSMIDRSPDRLLYAAPMVLAFHGIFSHFRRLRQERYLFEQAAIDAAANLHALPNDHGEDSTEHERETS